MNISCDLSIAERSYFERVLDNLEAPDLKRMWALMDEAWIECGCDPEIVDERINKFYSHPVWLLNGLFIEQHTESLKNRQEFSAYVARIKPRRIADFGGGYGTLSRMIGECCPETEVHIVEPHPHNMAVSLTAKTKNVRFIPEFTGEYDILVATDVFEHVPDPLLLAEHAARHLRMGGQFVIANCFWPVIRCHLPSTFHFRWSWDKAMRAMNLLPGEKVAYGRAYEKVGPVSAAAARKIERRSKLFFPVIEGLPGRLRGPSARLLILP